MSESDHDKRREAVLLLREWSLNRVASPDISEKDRDIYAKILAGTTVLLAKLWPAKKPAPARRRATPPRRLTRADFDPDANYGRA